MVALALAYPMQRKTYRPSNRFLSVKQKWIAASENFGLQAAFAACSGKPFHTLIQSSLGVDHASAQRRGQPRTLFNTTWTCQMWNQRCNRQVKPAAGKLTGCIVSRKTSRDLNGALLRVLFLGAHAKCTTPSVDVPSVPRFTVLDHHGSQVYQKDSRSALALMGSLGNATMPVLVI